MTVTPTVSPTQPSTFDERALAQLPEAAGFTGELRTRALEQFEALPMPSQETEEWRYTDLSDLDLTFGPYTAGGRATSLDDVPGELLAAAGEIGDRAGLQIQHDSDVMITHLAPELAGRGVVFCDLDAAAAEHPDLVERHLHALVATDRTRFTALHAAFRTLWCLV